MKKLIALLTILALAGCSANQKIPEPMHLGQPAELKMSNGQSVGIRTRLIFDAPLKGTIGFEIQPWIAPKPKPTPAAKKAVTK